MVDGPSSFFFGGESAKMGDFFGGNFRNWNLKLPLNGCFRK